MKPTDPKSPSPSTVAAGSGHERLRPSGGYRGLRTFQATTLVYDATASFCKRFIDPKSRTIDQMVQAARSGRQNLAEGSRASAASSQTELRLVNVARASLDELLLDYEDFLRQRNLPQWHKDDPAALAVRAVARTLPTHPSDPSDPTDPTISAIAAAYAQWLQHRDAAVVANALICLIHQANYLLDQQISGLEQQFVAENGYTEQLAAARIAARANVPSPTPSTPPNCPICGKPMALRMARKGPRAGTQFWGCTGYPACRGSMALDGAAPLAPTSETSSPPPRPAEARTPTTA